MESLSLIRFGILTVSDRCSAKEVEDKSGPALEAAIRGYNGFSSTIVMKACVPDNVLDIAEKLILWSSTDSCCDVILTTGGTGFSSRDVTPEATLKVVTKRCDALALMGSIRSVSPYAFLSRAAAGIRDKTIIINFPGSVRGATECFQIIAPLLPHAVHLVSENIEAVSLTHTSNQTHISNHFLHNIHMLPTTNANILSHHLFMGMDNKIPTAPFKSQVSTVKSGLRPRESQWPMINLKDAQNIVVDVASKVTPFLESVPLMECLGRIGGDCTSSVNLPPFRASVKDGYAVRVADGISPRKVVAASAAGNQSSEILLKDGECVRINTGAPLPPGADAVVQVEDTRVLEMNDESDEVKIEVLTAPTPGLDIREIGSDMAAGCVLMKDGDKITSSCLGVLASAGITQVPCWRVRVCVFSTGDELVEPGQPLASGKVYDSNRLTLISLLRENSFPSTDGGIIRDQPDEIYKRIHGVLKRHDVIITTGSVSMGDKDYLKQVLAVDLKAKIHFGRIDLKPGKPTTFAELVMENGEHKLIFSLPGNPVSAAVTCHLLVLPALRKITQHKSYFLPSIKVKMAEDVKFDEMRKEFKRAVVTYNHSGLPIASISGGQASSRLGSMLEANALITCDKPLSTVTKGSEVDALIIQQLKFLS